MEETNIIDTNLETTNNDTEKEVKKEKTKFVKISKGIQLEYNPDENPFIPTSEIDFKNTNKIIEQIAVAINANIPVLLSGETGTGKTSAIRHLAAKTHHGFRRVNHTGGTTTDDIVGKILVNKEGTFWVDGVLIDAMKNGYWYLADEINASSAEILFVYHSLLDDDGYIVLPENGGEIIRPHKNFKFFATINPSADYSGTKELNKALMSRFLVLKTDFPNPKTEAEILVERCGISEEMATKLVEFAVAVRATHAKEKIQFILSTRDLIMWGKMLNIYKKYMISGEMSIINKVGRDDRDAIKDLLALHFKVLDDLKPGEKEPAFLIETSSKTPFTGASIEELNEVIERIESAISCKKEITFNQNDSKMLINYIENPARWNNSIKKLSTKAIKKIKEINEKLNPPTQQNSSKPVEPSVTAF